jgi:hypothetical protein
LRIYKTKFVCILKVSATENDKKDKHVQEAPEEKAKNFEVQK